MGESSVDPCALRVLVAEDSEMNQLLARSLLTKLGCRVTLANDGREACALVAAQTFDMIFMDCEMPEMDGLAATQEIRRRELASNGPHVVIIALTASSEARDRDACFAAGMDDFMSKPFRREAMREVLLRNSPARAAGQ
jgi:CheY-like chemotaxis protein